MDPNIIQELLKLSAALIQNRSNTFTLSRTGIKKSQYFTKTLKAISDIITEMFAGVPQKARDLMR